MLIIAPPSKGSFFLPRIIRVITTIVKRFIMDSPVRSSPSRPKLFVFFHPRRDLFPAVPPSFNLLRLWCTLGDCEVCSMDSLTTARSSSKSEASAVPRETLTITDNRTGKAYEVPISNGTIRAVDLRQIRTGPEDFGMMSYDPAYTNTASCISRITYIDGDKGILRYRGYPIEELAEKSNYLETAYLLLQGELPTDAQLKDWAWHISHHTFIHESIKKF